MTPRDSGHSLWFVTRLKFISSKENLKNVMNMLRDKSASIQYEVGWRKRSIYAVPERSI